MIIGPPGHYRQGANHFLGLCDECDAQYLSRMTLDEVHDWGPFSGTRGKIGTIRQAMYEAYCHVWATEVHRFGSTYGHETEPTDGEVIELVAELRKTARERKRERREGKA